MVGYVYYGNSTQLDTAETYFRDFLEAEAAQKVGDVFYVTKNGVTKPYPLRDKTSGELMGFDLFAKATLKLAKGKDIDEAVVLGGGKQMGVVKSVTLVEAPKMKADGTYTKGKVKVTFDSGREETIAGGLGDFEVGSERELGSATPSGKGAGTIVSESDSAYKNRYVNAVVDVPKLKTLTKSGSENLSPTDVVSHLSKLTGLGFEVEDVANPLYPNMVRVTAADETEYYFKTNKDTLDEQIKGLITFINTNMLDAKYDAADKKSVIGPKKEGTEIETEADNLLNE